MKRLYTDTSHFRAPFDSPNLSLSGLGGDSPYRKWPARRSYQDVSDFRAPYDNGYYQDNTLMGLGAAAPIPTAPDALPEEFRRYVMTGAIQSTLVRDLGAASNQIPRWGWGVISVLSLAAAYGGYKKWQSERKKTPSSGT